MRGKIIGMEKNTVADGRTTFFFVRDNGMTKALTVYPNGDIKNDIPEDILKEDGGFDRKKRAILTESRFLK